MFALLALLFCAGPVAAQTRNVQDNCEITYTVLDSDGAAVADQEPTIAVKKASSGYWLDHA
jgi:hypothetical protein